MSVELTSSLLSFRIGYLMAVAEAWQNSQFQQQLLESPNVLKLPGFTKYLPSEGPLFWKASVKLRINNLSWHMDTAPVGSNGWIGPYDEFVIKIPNAPVDDKQKSTAISAYYQMFPTFFGGGMVQSPSQITQSTSSVQAVTDAGGLGIGGPENFLSFGALTMRIIAYAWANGEFLAKLTDPNVENAAELLTEYFQFTNPWNFNIRFSRDDNFNWNPVSGWPDGILNSIILNFPETPPLDQQSIAIASYNDSGPGYPYTCN